MAALTYQDIAFSGSAITLQAAGGAGDTTQPDPKGFLWVKNSGGASRTVTVTVPGTTFGQPNTDAPTTVPAGSERLIGPLVGDLANVDTFFVVVATYTPDATGLTVAAVRLGTPPPNLPT